MTVDRARGLAWTGGGSWHAPVGGRVAIAQVMAGKNVLVAAHGNSLRAICKYLEAWFTDANGVSPKFGRAPVHLKSGDLLFSDDGASIPLNTGGRPPYMRFGEGCLVSLSHGPSSFAYFDSGTTDISVVPLIL
ncbi:unnamed protein product [Effrenium voratum]|uniref:Phosphoglycerate mutase n=1 Tax=Effrenium voratum TaxID=2562239 RepID=A0AA36MK60_9DINO|nr:unnamed protein product [Effrenium voratum]